jgi:hypothetical protein
MIKHVMAASVLIGTSMMALPVQAANCANRDLVVERLQSNYDEAFTAGGLQVSQTTQMMVEVWASEETGTFTVMLTTPEGMTCVVATGTDWHHVAPVEKVQDSAS